MELLYTLVTWLPRFQRDPEGQVYLETIAAHYCASGQIGTYGSRLIFNDVGHHRASVHEAIREVFEAIAEENVEVNEEIMPYVPRSYFPLMTVHQAKGLEFPLVVALSLTMLDTTGPLYTRQSGRCLKPSPRKT